MSSANVWVLRDAEGRSFRGVGLNLCWESRDSDDSAWFGRLHEDPKFSYDQMVPRLAALGVNFLRVWMVYWNLPVDWPTPSNNRRYRSAEGQRFNPDGTAALVRLLRLCEAHGIRLMLCLETHVGFLGEGWALNPYNRANGGPAATPREFFTLPEARSLYRDKLDFLVQTVGTSPAVACWEFFNEIDNLTFDPSYGGPADDPAVVDWHREMAAYLRAQDPLHRWVTTSVSHREIPGLWDKAGLDLNQHHIYCRTNEIPNDLKASVSRTGRPHVIGEFGKHWDWSLDFRTLEPGFSDDLVRGLWLGLFSPTPILPLTWWWEYFEDRGEWEVFRHVRQVSDAMLAVGNGSFELLAASTGPSGIERRVRTGSVVWTLRLPIEGRAVSVVGFDGDRQIVVIP